jgi:Fe2+ transport system protein FeoA
MSQAAVLPLTHIDAPLASAEGCASPLPLSGVPLGGSAVVSELVLEADIAAWLRAVGISEGERVTVLRCAAFGGPIHVRTSSGGEFALHRSLAASVMTKGMEPPP